MRIRYTSLALADLAEAHAFIRDRDPGAARSVVLRIRDSVVRLADYPESGRPGRVAGTRELVVPGTPFVVAYRRTADTLDVLAVVHAARRWPSTFAD